MYTVRHVFGGFVESQESGIRNAEFATLSNVTCWSILYSFMLLQLAEAQFEVQSLFPFQLHRILNRMSSKPWLIKALRKTYRAFCCYSNVSEAVT